MPITLANSLRQQLRTSIEGGHAHASFADAVANFPVDQRSVVPPGLPYSPWQILEHIRIAQRDILDFCDNSDGTYQTLTWPKDYWPATAAPPNPNAWDASIAAVLDDRTRFLALLEAGTPQSLTAPLPWGEGQTLLYEALLILDHAAYHVGELIVLRRLLHCWK